MTHQPRGRLQGTAEIVKYNIHQYLGALGFLALAIAALLFLKLPTIVSLVLLLAISVVGYWSIASIIVSFIVYDASRIYDPVWMRTLVDDSPAKWANVHAGVDDFSGPLSHAYGQPLYNWDIFDERTMSEPSILRARSIRSSALGATVDFRKLPCNAGELDAVFAFFVLHEIRDDSLRRDCFDEIARCTSPSGKLVIVEHLRDLPNFVAFGPGLLHFWPRSEWLRSASLAGFELLNEAPMTPFVRVMVFKKL
ncbi:MAG: class I SAM-dependent methyltransferase [Armatimonadota bacterium]|nr:class I SAM-dependent methyltransferase [Armatimonadota bacterium]